MSTHSSGVLSRVPGFCGILLAMAALAVVPFPVFAAEHWIKVTSPHFELYTLSGAKSGREAILHFEQVRMFFLRASPAKQVPAFPVRIVAFRTENQYKPYRISDAAFAYYAGGESRDYIVMQNISPESYPVAIHEYMHLILRHTKLKLPLWLNEGLADLYSSLKPLGNRAFIGDLLPGRVQTISTSKALDLPTLTAVDQHSPMYNERNKAGIFYAQSWALTHMLYLSKDYRPNFPKFLRAVASGKPEPDAFSEAFGKTVPQVQKDLREYLTSRQLFGATFDIKLEHSAEEPDIVEVSEFGSDMLLADLLAVTGKRAEAIAAYGRLAEADGKNPEIEESLGYLAWISNDTIAARKHFGRALELGSQNPKMCYQYALLERQAGLGANSVIPALKKTLELKPDYAEARLVLGHFALEARDFPLAFANLRLVKNVTTEQAIPYFSALAYASYETANLEEARKAAARAKELAKTPEELERSEQMLRYVTQDRPAQSMKPPGVPGLSQESAPPRIARRPPVLDPDTSESPESGRPVLTRGERVKRVEGTAKHMDCVNGRIHVLVESNEMVFAIPDPKAIVVQSADATSFEFKCGPQKPFPIAIDYVLSSQPQAGIAGNVRTLVIK